MLRTSSRNFWVKKSSNSSLIVLYLEALIASLGMPTKGYIIPTALVLISLALSCSGEDPEGLCISCLLHLITFDYLLLANGLLRYSKFHWQTIA